MYKIILYTVHLYICALITYLAIIAAYNGVKIMIYI